MFMIYSIKQIIPGPGAIEMIYVQPQLGQVKVHCQSQPKTGQSTQINKTSPPNGPHHPKVPLFLTPPLRKRPICTPLYPPMKEELEKCSFERPSLIYSPKFCIKYIFLPISAPSSFQRKKNRKGRGGKVDLNRIYALVSGPSKMTYVYNGIRVK